MDAVLSVAKSHPPDAQRGTWAMKVLWSTFEGPLFAASLELWLAARSDEDLLAALVPQERIVGRAIRDMAADLFGEQTSAAAGFNECLEVLLDAMRGAAARGVLRTAAQDRKLLATWSALMSPAVMAAFQEH